MRTYIYADVLFLVNLLVNYLILLSAGKVSGHSTRWTRLFFSSALGSLYAVSALFIPVGSFYNLPARMAFGLFMVTLAYPGRKISSFLGLSFSFFLCSFIAAGTAFALATTGVGNVLKRALFPGEPTVKWWTMALALLFMAGLPLVARAGGYRLGRSLPLVHVDLVIGGRAITLTALVDTGNDLRDPVSGLPVIVVDLNSLSEIIPGELTAFFTSTWDSVPGELRETLFQRRLRLIPYKNVSGTGGILPGFKPDFLILREKNGREAQKEVVVGVSGSPLSPSGLYQALLHPDLVNP